MLPALLILTAGLLYSYFNPNNFILITTVALAGLITLPCLIVVAVGDAEKRAKKRKQKQQLEDDEFSPEAKERLIKSLDEKYQTIISKNNEMTAKVSSLFTSPDALEEFMNYINKELTGTALTLTVSGRLDTLTAPMLEQEIKASCGDITELTLDFQELQYISSAGLRGVLGAHKAMKGNLVVKNVNEVVMEVFDVTGFSDILTIV